ncbi:MAG: HNH endonuclease [Leptolyngbya sp. RL_3_1]|nr:HNH endonuclease [Leptolyngbya sp. RL_3_1]
MTRPKFSPVIQAAVRQRAQFLCEYCHAAEQWQYAPFTLDHIIPLMKVGGDDSLDNLALACFPCNRHKSARQVSLDPFTQQSVARFNPRKQAWSDHFIWSMDYLTLIGQSATGRATIEQLKLNRARLPAIRAADLVVNRHPPTDDPIQSRTKPSTLHHRFFGSGFPRNDLGR